MDEAYAKAIQLAPDKARFRGPAAGRWLDYVFYVNCVLRPFGCCILVWFARCAPRIATKRQTRTVAWKGGGRSLGLLEGGVEGFGLGEGGLGEPLTLQGASLQEKPARLMQQQALSKGVRLRYVSSAE